MYALLSELFPICRSLTGDGVRETIRILKRSMPLEEQTFRTGTRCFDWEIPPEWNITSATIRDRAGNVVLDFARNNLHVLGYSEPVSGWFPLAILRPHIFTLPDQPDSIPHLTSYYHRQWGFCMAHNDLVALKDGEYFAEINSRLELGELIVSEARLPGTSDKEILISCYYCHPSLADDGLSGVVLAAQLYQELAGQERYYGYRFVFAPETIGAIAFLSRHPDIRQWLHAGLVVTCVGDPGLFNYKRSRQGHHALDRVAENVLKFSGFPYRIREFWPSGSDERQYCSPGFNLPVGSIMRSVYGEFPEYHTSKDNLGLVTPRALEESLEVYLRVLASLQGNRVYLNLNPHGEPQLSNRGLYPKLGSQKTRDEEIHRRMWILNYSDGEHALIDIAEKMDAPMLDLIPSAHTLERAGLLRELPR